MMTKYKLPKNEACRSITLPPLSLSILILIILFLCAPVIFGQEIEITVQGRSRRAVIFNPQSSDAKHTPYVIVLHGGAGNIDSMRTKSKFDQLARREGFAVAYAEGTEFARGRYAWNTGFQLRGQVNMADDIAYLDRLIDRLISDHGADPARIYMTGSSNGAMMTFVYGIERAERLAAVATIVGAMFTFEKEPSVPLPILIVNGQLDNEVPIDGGFSKNPLVRRVQRAPFKSMAQTVEFWKKVNRSKSSAEISRIKDSTFAIYPGMNDGVSTVAVVDSKGGHGWPGARELRKGNVPIQSFDGAKIIWDFFRDKVRKTEIK